MGSAARAAVTIPVQELRGGRPGTVALWNSQAPFGVSTRPRASTGTPQPSAKATAARVGEPSALNATDTGGPRFSIICTGCSRCRSLDQHRQPAGCREGAQGGEAEARAAQPVLRPGWQRPAPGRQATWAAALPCRSRRENPRCLVSWLTIMGRRRARTLLSARQQWGSRGRRGCRGRPAPRSGPSRARAGCSAGAR